MYSSTEDIPTPKKPRNMFNPTRLIIIGVIVLIAFIAAINSFSIIDEGHIGVQYRFGQIVKTDLKPGPHIKMPFIESISQVDVREHMYSSATPAYTKDTQTVENIKFTVNYKYANPAELIKTIGIANIENQIIIPRTNAILKNLTGQYRAEDLIQNRASLQAQVFEMLGESLLKDGIMLTSFNIENIDFEDSFEQAIRLKVEAEQDALRKKNETEAKKEEAAQIVIAAQAEADAEKLRADAEAYAIEAIQKQLNASPEYTELQKILNWDGKFPDTLIIGEQGATPFLILD